MRQVDLLEQLFVGQHLWWALASPQSSRMGTQWLVALVMELAWCLCSDSPLQLGEGKAYSLAAVALQSWMVPIEAAEALAL